MLPLGSYSKIFIFQSNSIYICSLPLALICLLVTRLVFVFQMLKRLCWFVQEICLDSAHKAYLLTFDIFTGWETKWKIQVFKLHRWHLSQSIYFQNKEYSCSRQSLEQHNSDRDPHTLRALGPAEASWNPSTRTFTASEEPNIQVLNCNASTANKCKMWQYNRACGYFTYLTFTCV